MDRKTFLKNALLFPLSLTAMKLNALQTFATGEDQGQNMPMLFVGHGSPMNAIEENEFVTGWRTMVKLLPRPRAIVCISAHWETRGTFVTVSPNPKTIHDFGGFPAALYQVQYPAPGSPETANEVKSALVNTLVGLDQQWGLDHGAWSVIRHMYPAADVPVIELSLDYQLSPMEHYQLASQLADLRQKGILFIGSGNIVHNLGKIAWDKFNEPDFAFDWATEANGLIKNLVSEGNHQQLANYHQLGNAVKLAIPTPDHFLPLLYILAMQNNLDEISFFNDKAVAGSLTMTSVKVG